MIPKNVDPWEVAAQVLQRRVTELEQDLKEIQTRYDELDRACDLATEREQSKAALIEKLRGMLTDTRLSDSEDVNDARLALSSRSDSCKSCGGDGLDGYMNQCMGPSGNGCSGKGSKAELEGDNGLRARNEAGWALANSRLQLLEKLRAQLEFLKDKDNDRCQGCDVLRSERYQKGSCPGGCFGDGAWYLGIEVGRLDAELKKERDRRVEHRQMNQALNEQVQRLQKELDRLRDVDSETEVLRFRALFEEQKLEREFAESRLSTATGLLNRWMAIRYQRTHGSRADVVRDTRAFIFSAPVPTERELAERVVLKACNALPTGWVVFEMNQTTDKLFIDWCKAILALRNVKP